MSDHETTLLSEAKRLGRLAEQFIGSAPREGQARRAERDAAVEALRAAEKLLIQVVEKRRAACLAGTDALRRGTCADCKNAEARPFGMDGWVWCNCHASIRRPADGCILHYAPTEPTR